jgi:homoserine O-succinyltransferase
LRIGLLNMMADGALRATDRQFSRLLGCGSDPQVAPLQVFTLPEIARTATAQLYIAENYRAFEEIRQQGLDALIITGVNLSDPRLETQAFWHPLVAVMDWAQTQVGSVLCSCLATHAVMQFRYGQHRRPLNTKLWGVFAQEVCPADHPLTRGLPPRVAVPHSRHNDLTAEQFAQAGLRPLIAGGGAGVHLAADSESRLVVLQGHPEYDTISLLKEFKREVAHYHGGLRPDFPPFPEGLLAPEGQGALSSLCRAVKKAQQAGRPVPEFPEHRFTPHLINHWAEATARMFASWRDLVRENLG